ncbi:hypothetical protein NDU88_006707 [Pleurodeles waltl]|uniref:Uncharacterized protein n=1 Tax=Pleurodeles waltl TaxID=8319 RepID=A0AAV7QIG6_PLEWA|nr:hypothetical protein NDU88_006707 [Pleurodeles waltl]
MSSQGGRRSIGQKGGGRIERKALPPVCPTGAPPGGVSRHLWVLMRRRKVKGGPQAAAIQRRHGSPHLTQPPTGPRRGNSAAPPSRRPGGHYKSQAPWHESSAAKKVGDCLQREGGAPLHWHKSTALWEPVARASHRKAQRVPSNTTPATGAHMNHFLPQHPEHECEANATRESQPLRLQLWLLPIKSRPESRGPHAPRAPTRPQHKAGGRRAPPSLVQEETLASSLPDF